MSYDTSTSTKILGGYIGKYNRIYKRKKTAKLTEQYDIKNVVDRLTSYKEYSNKVRKQRKLKEVKEERKMVAKVKKTVNKILYSNNTNKTKVDKYKPVHNPYMKIYERLSSAVDPKLLEKYRTTNVYSLYEFRYLTLPRTNHDITAGQAWHGLIKAWKGFKISGGNRCMIRDEDNMKIYASTIQKWNYLLETDRIPTFPDIGISAEGFKHADILKLYFDGYENEVIS